MNWVENGDSSVEFRCSDTKANIFLIGDSMRRGYCATVRTIMADRAEVFYIADNCRSTQYVIINLKKWAGMFDHPERVDLIHFNCGHWDVAHWSGHPLSLTSEGEYEKNLQMIVWLLKKYFPNARLIFATTTPMNPDRGVSRGNNPRSDEEIERYNAILVRVTAENGIEINDLNRYMKDWGSAHFADYCHLTPASFALLGQEVARVLDEKLKGSES